MDNRVTIGQLQAARPAPLLRTRGQAGAPAQDRASAGPADGSFRQLLDRQTLRFSHHAEQRLRQRGIELEPDQVDRIASAVDQAAAKGAKDSLVLFKDIAMIVSVPNRTVVTAIDGPSMKEHIFTQIDSAVVIG